MSSLLTGNSAWSCQAVAFTDRNQDRPGVEKLKPVEVANVKYPSRLQEYSWDARQGLKVRSG